jgi:hypothetical protein
MRVGHDLNRKVTVTDGSPRNLKEQWGRGHNGNGGYSNNDNNNSQNNSYNNGYDGRDNQNGNASTTVTSNMSFNSKAGRDRESHGRENQSRENQGRGNQERENQMTKYKDSRGDRDYDHQSPRITMSSVRVIIINLL